MSSWPFKKDEPPICRVEIGPGNPVKELWLYADGSASIGDVQFGRLVSGVWLPREATESLKIGLNTLTPPTLTQPKPVVGQPGRPDSAGSDPEETP